MHTVTIPAYIGPMTSNQPRYEQQRHNAAAICSRPMLVALDGFGTKAST